MPGSAMREQAVDAAEQLEAARLRELPHIWSRLSTWPAHEFHTATHVLSLKFLLQLLEARVIEKKSRELAEAVANRLALARRMAGG